MSSLCNKILFISSFKFIKSWDILFFAKKELSKQDNFILNDLPIYIMPLSLLVCMQLLSFFVAKIKNNEIDTPRNLANKLTITSVSVEETKLTLDKYFSFNSK